MNNLKSKLNLTSKDNNNSDRKSICKNKINNFINKYNFIDNYLIIFIKKNY